MNKQRRLWLAVLAQALTDSIRSGDYTYFDMRNPEFLCVCSLSEKNPATFIRNIKKMLRDSRKLNKLRKRTDCKTAPTDFGEVVEYEDNAPGGIEEGGEYNFSDGVY